MWFGDLEMAIQAVKGFKNVDYTLLKKIVPAVDGIVFETTSRTFIKWFSADGHVEEHNDGDWRRRK